VVPDCHTPDIQLVSVAKDARKKNQARISDRRDSRLIVISDRPPYQRLLGGGERAQYFFLLQDLQAQQGMVFRLRIGKCPVFRVLRESPYVVKKCNCFDHPEIVRWTAKLPGDQ